jgi:hypothetical protein
LVLDFDIFSIYNKDMKTKKPVRGRPRKSAENVKSESVLLRLETREKEGFTAAANMAGVPLAVWIRERLRKVAVGELEAGGRQVPFLDAVKT